MKLIGSKEEQEKERLKLVENLKKEKEKLEPHNDNVENNNDENKNDNSKDNEKPLHSSSDKVDTTTATITEETKSSKE